MKLRRWWSRKYRLPENHELLLSRTVSSLLMEFYMDLHEERDALEETLQRSAVADSMQMRERLAQLKTILDGTPVPEMLDDPLVAQWERDLAEGRVPDLELKSATP